MHRDRAQEANPASAKAACIIAESARVMLCRLSMFCQYLEKIKRWQDACDRGLDPEDFVEEMKKQGTRVPGIGHRIKSKVLHVSAFPASSGAAALSLLEQGLQGKIAKCSKSFTSFTHLCSIQVIWDVFALQEEKKKEKKLLCINFTPKFCGFCET